MKLQLALDLVANIKEAVAAVEAVGAENVDIVEVGTPVIINDGLHAVKAIKNAFPNLKVLADLKIMDAAGFEVMKAHEAGADLVTILAVAEDASIKGAVDKAKELGKEVLADMIAVKDLAKRAAELDDMGVDYICVHTGYDLQAEGQSPFEALKTIKSVVKKSKTAIAGGIKMETLPNAIAAKPDLIIVGGGITQQPDPKAAAQKMQELIKKG